jgi:hypothetical protein
MLFIVSGEAQQSHEADDLTRSYEVGLSIDGITQRTDCDSRNEMDNARKLHLMAVRENIWFTSIILSSKSISTNSRETYYS